MLLLTISLLEVAISNIRQCRRLDLTSISCSKLLSSPRRLSRGFSEGNRWGNLLWPPPGSRMEYSNIHFAAHCNIGQVFITCGILIVDNFLRRYRHKWFRSKMDNLSADRNILPESLLCPHTHRRTSWLISWTWWTSSSWSHSPSSRGTAGCSCGAVPPSGEWCSNIYNLFIVFIFKLQIIQMKHQITTF